MQRRPIRGRLNTIRTWLHTIRSRYFFFLYFYIISCLYCFCINLFLNYASQSEKQNDIEEEEEEEGSDKSKSEVNDDDEDDEDESGEVYSYSEYLYENRNMYFWMCQHECVYFSYPAEWLGFSLDEKKMTSRESPLGGDFGRIQGINPLADIHHFWISSLFVCLNLIGESYAGGDLCKGNFVNWLSVILVVVI